MHRFYLPSPEIKSGDLLFNGPEWHHCKNVMRSKVGDKITLFDGKGTEYLATIRDESSKQANLKIINTVKTPPPPYQITLAQALPKSKAMDYIVQKATELGVCEIIPVLSDRSVVKLDPEEGTSKINRWQDIAIESAKQCGLNWLPCIHHPKTVREVVELRKFQGHAYIGSLQPEARRLWDYLAEFPSHSRNALLMIGPEGDFTPAELGMARSAGFKPLSLGPMVLRCDTAAIYSISTLSYELTRTANR